MSSGVPISGPRVVQGSSSSSLHHPQQGPLSTAVPYSPAAVDSKQSSEGLRRRVVANQEGVGAGSPRLEQPWYVTALKIVGYAFFAAAVGCGIAMTGPSAPVSLLFSLVCGFSLTGVALIGIGSVMSDRFQQKKPQNAPQIVQPSVQRSGISGPATAAPIAPVGSNWAKAQQAIFELERDATAQGDLDKVYKEIRDKQCGGQFYKERIKEVALLAHDGWESCFTSGSEAAFSTDSVRKTIQLFKNWYESHYKVQWVPPGG